MADKKNYTFSIDPEIHRTFKIENTINESDMSLSIENFMRTYNNASKQMREERILKKSE